MFLSAQGTCDNKNGRILNLLNDVQKEIVPPTCIIRYSSSSSCPHKYWFSETHSNETHKLAKQAIEMHQQGERAYIKWFLEGSFWKKYSPFLQPDINFSAEFYVCNSMVSCNCTLSLLPSPSLNTHTIPRSISLSHQFSDFSNCKYRVFTTSIQAIQRL